jgi:membrane protease YdiL (CAAX protease family)
VKLFVSITSVALLLILTGIAGTIIRINQLEKGELFHQSDLHTLSELSAKPGSTSISARLDSVTLRAGEHALFEICSTDRLPKQRWKGVLEFAVLHLDKMKLMFKTPLDQDHLEIVKRNKDGACLVLGGGQIASSGRYSIEAVWHEKRPTKEVMQVGLYTRVQGRSPLVAGDRHLVIAIALGAMLLIVAMFFAPASEQKVLTTKPIHGQSETLQTLQTNRNENRLRILFIAILCIAVIWGLIGWLPLFGSAMSFCKGLLLAAAEAGLAFSIARRLGTKGTRVEQLALLAPARSPLTGLALSVLSADALVLVAQSALSFVPSTSEAPIQTFVAWPSGMLCFAALGVVVPLGEEVFFRGFLYRAVLAYGRFAAFAITIVAFVGLHLQQVWGNWGGLVALVVTGTVLTALRAYSGSTLLPAVTHLLYNFILSLGSL